MKNWVLILQLAILGAIALTGCSKGDFPSPKQETGKARVALLASVDGDDYCIEGNVVIRDSSGAIVSNEHTGCSDGDSLDLIPLLPGEGYTLEISGLICHPPEVENYIGCVLDATSFDVVAGQVTPVELRFTFHYDGSEQAVTLSSVGAVHIYLGEPQSVNMCGNDPCEEGQVCAVLDSNGPGCWTPCEDDDDCGEDQECMLTASVDLIGHQVDFDQLQRLCTPEDFSGGQGGAGGTNGSAGASSGSGGMSAGTGGTGGTQPTAGTGGSSSGNGGTSTGGTSGSGGTGGTSAGAGGENTAGSGGAPPPPPPPPPPNGSEFVYIFELPSTASSDHVQALSLYMPEEGITLCQLESSSNDFYGMVNDTYYCAFNAPADEYPMQIEVSFDGEQESAPAIFDDTAYGCWETWEGDGCGQNEGCYLGFGTHTLCPVDGDTFDDDCVVLATDAEDLSTSVYATENGLSVGGCNLLPPVDFFN